MGQSSIGANRRSSGHAFRGCSPAQVVQYPLTAKRFDLDPMLPESQIGSRKICLFTTKVERFLLIVSSVNMQKTKKSVAKRFKLSGTGKLIRRSPGKRHLLSSKTVKQKRRLSKDKLVAPGHAAQLIKCLPTGLR